MLCLNDLFLNSDFAGASRVVFKDGFDFSPATRNCLRESNRAELLRLYYGFDMREFIFFLLENYYPKVGWR